MTRNELLDKYLASLEPSVRIAKSRDIRLSLGISRYVLSDWRRGRTPIHPVFFDKIIEELGVNLYENVEN